MANKLFWPIEEKTSKNPGFWLPVLLREIVNMIWVYCQLSKAMPIILEVILLVDLRRSLDNCNLDTYIVCTAQY